MSSPLSGKWVGTIQGTNLGAIFADFAETKGQVSGVVHIADSVLGVAIYVVTNGDLSLDSIRLGTNTN